MTQAVVGPSHKDWVHFRTAMLRNETDQVKDLLRRYPALLSFADTRETPCKDEDTALSGISGLAGRAHFVQMLLEAKADPNFVPWGDNSKHPLCMAVTYKAYDSAQLLIKAKANPNFRIKQALERPILYHTVLQSDALSVVQLLIEYKASVNATNSLGASALFCHAMGSYTDPYVDALLEAGAEVEEDASESLKERRDRLMSKFSIKEKIEAHLGRHLTAIVLNYLYK